MSSTQTPLQAPSTRNPRSSKKRDQPAHGTAKAENAELAALCNALSSPIRVQILRMLMRRGWICGEIVKVVGLAQSTVSEHLRILKAAGLVTGEIDGPRTCYCVNLPAICRLGELVADLT
jgi:ArsR family transcriptional regulator